MARMHQRNRWISFLISMTMLIPVMLYAASDVGSDGLFNFTKDTVISSSEVNKNFDVLGNFMTTYEDAITVDGNGNVGIGTTSPANSLEIADNAGGVRISYAPEPAHYYLDLTQAVVSDSVSYRFQTYHYSLGDKDVLFFHDLTGNVGIGTTTPRAKLHVAGHAMFGATAVTDDVTLSLKSSAANDGIIMRESYGGNQVLLAAVQNDGDGNGVRLGLWDGNISEQIRFDSKPNSTSFINNGGNFGIGTTAPAGALHIKSTNLQANAIDDGIAFLKSLGGDYQIQVTSNGGTPHLDFANSSNEDFDIRLAVYSNNKLAMLGGNIGINTTDPTYRLDVNGTLRAYGITDASSRQYKDHIRTLEADDALKALTALRPTRYHYKQDNTEERLGFIAEEVPELLAMKDRQGVSSMDVVAVLTRVVQVQQTQLEEQRKQLETLRKQVDGIAATATK